MNHMARWARIVLCGILTGVVWHVLSAIVIALVGQSFLEAIEEGRRHKPTNGPLFLLLDTAMGIWAMWLYAAVRPRYASDFKAAIIVGLAWWTLKTLQSAKWVGLGFIPWEAAPSLLVVTLPLPIVAVCIGARLYREKKVEPPV